MTNTNACPLCRGAEFEAHRFGLLGCAGCGLVVDPAIFQPGKSESLNLAAFGDAYEPEASIWVRQFNRWKNRRYLGYLREAGAHGGELLEVGVGSGSFLRAARAAGFGVSGCDLSPVLCQRVERDLGISMHCGSLVTLPERKWNVVVMNHVLEHVQDPVAFLRAGRGRLKPGGILHVAVPNVGCWEARLSGWNCYEPYHVAYFNPLTLEKALRDAGFETIAQRTHETFSGWFLALLRTIRPSQRSQGSAPAVAMRPSVRRRMLEHPYRVAMVSAGVLSWPVRAVQAFVGRGDELIALARA